MSREIDTREDHPPAHLTERQRFHWIHGGWCVPPGREECAVRAAAAEEAMERAEWAYQVRDDPHAEREDGYNGTYSCVYLVSADGKPRYEFALWGIDTPSAEGDYGRAVAADLAMEALVAGAFTYPPDTSILKPIDWNRVQRLVDRYGAAVVVRAVEEYEASDKGKGE